MGLQVPIKSLPKAQLERKAGRNGTQRTGNQPQHLVPEECEDPSAGAVCTSCSGT